MGCKGPASSGLTAASWVQFPPELFTNIHCDTCGEVFERANSEVGQSNFCSHACSAKHSNAIRVRIKRPKLKKTKKPTVSICKICGGKYLYRTTRNRYCSDACKEIYLKEKIDYKKYREHCEFDFGIRPYIKEFDYDLVIKNGWYSITNPGGVSRDHMVSVMYGFRNKIHPSIISHPANCKLVTQRENSRKCDKCSISLEHLQEKIVQWN